MTDTLTFRHLVDRLVALGVLRAERVDATWQAVAGWIQPDDLVDDDLPMRLVDLGVAVQAHAGDAEVEDHYRSIIEGTAALSGGSVVVTDVALDKGDRDDDYRLTFRVNGEPRSWYEDHRDPEYIDMMAVIEQIGSLAPGGDDPRVIYGVLSAETGEDDFFLLLTPGQAKAMHDEFGLDLEEM